MKKSKCKTLYNHSVFLNPTDSPSTGHMSCYDGIEFVGEENEYENRFVAISDCFRTCRIHQTHNDTLEDFIEKVTLMHNSLGLYLEHLKSQRKETVEEADEAAINKIINTEPTITSSVAQAKEHQFALGQKVYTFEGIKGEIDRLFERNGNPWYHVKFYGNYSEDELESADD